MDDYLARLLEGFIVDGDPNPSGFLGVTTDPADASSILTMQDIRVFICHNIKRHVMYCEDQADGTKRYECLECEPG